MHTTMDSSVLIALHWKYCGNCLSVVTCQTAYNHFVGRELPGFRKKYKGRNNLFIKKYKESKHTTITRTQGPFLLVSLHWRNQFC